MRGFERDAHSNKWEKKYPALISTHGARNIEILLRSYLNQNTMLSKLSENEIKQICLNVGWNLADMFFLDFERMVPEELQEKLKASDSRVRRNMLKRYIDTIIDTIENTVYITLKRAEGGQERELMRKSIHETISRLEKVGGEEEQRRKPGWLPRFRRW